MVDTQIKIAVAYILQRLHQASLALTPFRTTKERDAMIRTRFEAGESQTQLAEAFKLSKQRIHQIIRYEK